MLIYSTKGRLFLLRFFELLSNTGETLRQNEAIVKLTTFITTTCYLSLITHIEEVQTANDFFWSLSCNCFCLNIRESLICFCFIDTQIKQPCFSIIKSSTFRDKRKRLHLLEIKRYTVSSVISCLSCSKFLDFVLVNFKFLFFTLQGKSCTYCTYQWIIRLVTT